MTSDEVHVGAIRRVPGGHNVRGYASAREMEFNCFKNFSAYLAQDKDLTAVFTCIFAALNFNNKFMNKPNHFDYLNFFMNRLHFVSLSQNDTMLYLYILKLVNQEYCKNPLEISTITLCNITGLAAKVIVRSRNHLVEAGLLKVTPGKRRSSSPVYQLLAFGDNHQEFVTDIKNDPKKDPKKDAKKDAKNDPKNDPKNEISPINNKIKNKNLNNNNNGDIVDAVAEGDDFYFLNEFFSEKNMGFVEQFAMSLNTTIEVVWQLAETAVAEWQLAGLTHPDYKSWARHLMNLIRIKRQRIRPAENQISTPNTNQSTTQNTCNYDVPANQLTLEMLKAMPEHILVARFGPEAKYDYGKQFILDRPELFD